ncbi:MAG: Ig-like domain-containing protein, partial [Pseudomonadota bacterium]
ATFGFDFADYSFQVAGSFLEVVHVSAQATIDLVENTVEWLSFADQTVSFSEAAAGATGGGGPPPPPPPPPDGDDVVDGAGLGDAGNTLGAATDIALDSDGNATINGSVGFDNDTNDYFKFVAAQSGSASFVLTGMSQSAYTRLYENGNQVASTGANNANDKTLTFDLVAGAEYVVKVDPWGSAETDYRLAIDTPAGGGGPAPLPTVTVDQAADNAGSTTGTIAQGGVTDDNSPTLSGSLSASLGSGQSVTIYRDGAAVGTATVNGQSWSFIDGSVGEGAHTWTARVVEPGREGDVSSGFGFTVDRTAPSVTVDSLTTTDGTPALSGTVNDPDATVSVTVNGQTAQATNSGNGTWSLVWAAVLAPGTYNVEARATDFAGNVGIDATSSELVIETSPPPPPATGNDVVNGADIGDGGNTLGAATAIALDSDGDAVIDGSVGFGDDTNDYFEFVAVGSGSASFALTGMSDSAYTRLFENGSQVASTGADNANDKTLTYDLTEGSIYVIKVDPWGSAETDYDLAINTPVGGAPPPPSGGDVVNGIGVGDAGNTLGAATSISLNGNGDANIVGSVGFGGDSNDYFKFVAPATGTATIELTGLSQSAYTRFYENGSQVANTGANNTGDKSLTYDLQAGVEYVVKVDPWGSAETDYDLQIDLLL